MSRTRQFAAVLIMATFAAGAATAVTAATTSPPTGIIPSVQDYAQAKRKCKSGYRYSNARMRCVRKRSQPRGSH